MPRSLLDNSPLRSLLSKNVLFPRIRDGIEAGHLRLGDRADIVVINPAALDERLEGYHEAPMAGLGEIERLVNRNDAAVDAVLINGRLAWRDGKIESGVGSETGFGRFLAAA